MSIKDFVNNEFANIDSNSFIDDIHDKFCEIAELIDEEIKVRTVTNCNLGTIVDEIINYNNFFINCVKGVPASSISLNNEDFDSNGRHKRCEFLLKDVDGNIYDNNKFDYHITKVYDENTNTKKDVDINIHLINTPIYINRGGRIFSEYFNSIKINKVLVDRYTPSIKIKLNISVLNKTDGSKVYFVDNRVINNIKYYIGEVVINNDTEFNKINVINYKYKE